MRRAPWAKSRRRRCSTDAPFKPGKPGGTKPETRENPGGNPPVLIVSTRCNGNVGQSVEVYFTGRSGQAILYLLRKTGEVAITEERQRLERDLRIELRPINASGTDQSGRQINAAVLQECVNVEVVLGLGALLDNGGRWVLCGIGWAVLRGDKSQQA